MRSLESLKAKTVTDPVTGCWLWRGGVRANGYGVIGGEAAHRVAYRAAYGDFPKELLACHRCDVRNCINPDHIFLGTHGDNSRDMARKGRQAFQARPELAARGDHNGSRTRPERRPRGERQHLAKLNDDVVAAMRATVRCGAFSARQWSKWLGLSYSTTKRAISGRTWAHIVCVLLFVGSPAFAQGRFERFCSRSAQGRSDRGLNCNQPESEYSFFEFAPTSGAGMGTACACTAVTGAKGEAVTFTRASSAYCTKEGLATTGLTTTSMVQCSTNQIRVEADGSGVLGILVENAGTNVILQSEDLATTWLTSASGVAAPTVTANQAVAPNGATTADRLQVPATTSGQYSYMYQTGWAAATRTTSVYLKGNGTSGTINLLSGTTPNACTACAYVADSWSRCALPSVGTASTFVFLGNDSASAVCTTSSKGAQDVFVWGLQHETGAYATSYVPTTTAAVTRAVDVPTVAGATLPYAKFSLAASVTEEWATATMPSYSVIMEGQTGNSSGVGFFFMPGAAPRIQTINAGALNLTAASQTVVAGTAYRVGTVSEGGNSSLYWNGSLIAGPTAKNTAAAWATATGIGYGPAFPTASDSIISRVCLDPSPTRCR